MWDFGTVRRDVRGGTIARAPAPPMPSGHAAPRQVQNGSLGRAYGSVRSKASSASLRRHVANNQSAAYPSPPMPSGHAYPPAPSVHSRDHALPSPSSSPASSHTSSFSGPESSASSSPQPPSAPPSRLGSGIIPPPGAGYDTIRFAGEVAEQQARVASGQWLDARKDSGSVSHGKQYDSDEEDVQLPVEEARPAHGGGEQAQEDGYDDGFDPVSDSRAILEDVIVPVLSSVSSSSLFGCSSLRS